jgi:hypothetical protein
MHRYLGPEFPRILAKENVEYRQANLTVPGLSTSFVLLSFPLTESNATASDCLIRI